MTGRRGFLLSVLVSLVFLCGAFASQHVPRKGTRHAAAKAHISKIGGKPFQTGMASWYGSKFQGQQAADGGTFDKRDYVAAHRTLPLGTRVKVVNPATGKSVVVTIKDRGPHSGKSIIDLSQAAARELGQLKDGIFPVKLYVVQESPRVAEETSKIPADAALSTEQGNAKP